MPISHACLVRLYAQDRNIATHPPNTLYILLFHSLSHMHIAAPLLPVKLAAIPVPGAPAATPP